MPGPIGPGGAKPHRLARMRWAASLIGWVEPRAPLM
jgi:hypothetical protein